MHHTPNPSGPAATARPTRPLPRRAARTATALLALCTLLAAGAPQPASAHAGLSEASAVSLVPVGLLLAAPVMLLSGAATLTVAAVQASGEGTVWVLERASDGARASLQLSAQALGGASVAVGTALTVTALSTGWVISEGSRVLAFVPNDQGTRLMHHERVMR